MRIRRDAGPASAREWRADEAKRNYNGERGGDWIKWYTPNLFIRIAGEVGGKVCLLATEVVLCWCLCGL